MVFEWDEEKNELNRIKHGISFQEAESVFDDEYAVYIYDDPHSIDEERFIIIGEDFQLRKMTVCHCYRGINEDIVRIISAREANRTEKEIYNRGYA